MIQLRQYMSGILFYNMTLIHVTITLQPKAYFARWIEP
jgi:hypothetical protein